MGIGVQEALIIVAILLLLFGAPVLTFILGYLLGRKRAGGPPVDSSAPASDQPHAKESPDE